MTRLFRRLGLGGCISVADGVYGEGLLLGECDGRERTENSEKLRRKEGVGLELFEFVPN